MPKTDINKAIAEFKLGTQKGFEQVYRLYYPRIRHFAYTLVGDEEEAKDIAIEQFMKAFEKREDLVSEVNIRAFLYVATRNACFNLLKHEKRKLSSHNEILFLQLQNEMSLEGEMISGEDLQLLNTSINQLPEQRKKVILMMYRDGLSISEIAEKLGLSEQVVKNYQGKALNFLRSVVSKNLLILIIVTVLIFFFEKK